MKQFLYCHSSLKRIGVHSIGPAGDRRRGQVVVSGSRGHEKHVRIAPDYGHCLLHARQDTSDSPCHLNRDTLLSS